MIGLLFLLPFFLVLIGGVGTGLWLLFDGGLSIGYHTLVATFLFLPIVLVSGIIKTILRLVFGARVPIDNFGLSEVN